MKPRLFIVLAVLAAAFAPAARALPSASDIRQAFSALDTGLNNGISLLEWEAAARALFRDADKNSDGYLIPAEIGDSDVVAATFNMADANADRRLDVREFVRLRQTIFNSADLDRDDVLTFYEYEIFTLLSETGWTDGNRNGRVEPSELRAGLENAFSRLDSDGNGSLAGAEHAYMSASQFRVSDANTDNALTKDEFVTGYLRVLGAL